VVGGAALLACGAALAAGAGAVGKARERALEPLEAAAGAWEAGGRTAFADIAGTVAARVDFPAGSSEKAGREAGPAPPVALEAVSEPLAGPWAPSAPRPLPHYEALKFQAEGRFSYNLSLERDYAPNPPVSAASSGAAVLAQQPCVNITLTFGGAGAALSGVPLYKHDARHLGVKQCRLHHGIHIGGVCHSLKVLAAVCVQVAQDTRAPGGWALAEVPGGCAPGATYPPKFTSHGGQASYRTWRSGTLSDIRVLFTVRSVEDPYLTAFEASHGTMLFGDTGRDRWTKAVACLAAGCALLLPTVLIQALRASERRRRGVPWLKYHSSDSEDDEEAEELALL